LNERLPLKDEIVGVYQELIDANKSDKPDIWAARSVTLNEDEKLTPVLVAAWDSGTDPSVFTDLLWSNPYEKPDGGDTDGNGYVDDVHGIAYDIHANRTTGLLCPLGDAADRMPTVMGHLKGLMDLQAAIDSPEATALKQHMAGLDPADVQGFIEDLGLAGNYAHGTHVAGIMTEGNPFAKLLIARLSYDHHMTPVARTVEWGTRDGAKCRDTVEYFKKHGVRVVNMSWGEAQEDAEDSLEKNGIGASAEERRELARKVFALQKEGLYEAIKDAPDILFVCAAGNADNDVEFDQYIASSFDLPNLLVVGAVDQAGDPTSFTSTGRTVQVYANGFEVESYVPGGQRMKMSGTSMASPNVANLAAKVLAIAPDMTPPKVIKLIKKGADKKTVGPQSFLLMNPKQTIKKIRSSG
ncbi:MAG TPA: S8 family serine peptidase, partial [Phycisphaerae bacterium]|nr:S8 family serine peptidase [Phycisphaerae bacterium]